MTEDQTLEQVAGDNVGDWMRQAVQNIDAEFGDGYAKAHSELIAAMIQASAIDSGVAYIHNVLNKHLDDLVNLAYYFANEKAPEIGEEYPHEE